MSNDHRRIVRPMVLAALNFFYDDAMHALPNRVVVDPQNGSGTQTSTTAFDYYTGLVTSQTDANGHVTTIDYTNQLLNLVDPFGRPGIVISPLVPGVSRQQQTAVSSDCSCRLLVPPARTTEQLLHPPKLLRNR
jgi:hypothetical protein